MTLLQKVTKPMLLELIVTKMLSQFSYDNHWNGYSSMASCGSVDSFWIMMNNLVDATGKWLQLQLQLQGLAQL